MSDASQIEVRKLSQEEVEQIIAKHEQWIASNEEDGKRANFSYCDLSNLELVKRDLAYANFSMSVCYKTNFSGSKFDYVDFTASKCEDANFTNTYCHHTIFTNGYFTNANFSHSSIDAAVFIDSNCIDVNFKVASCQGTNFTNANCTRANFFTNMTQGINFKNANLTEADISAISFRNITEDGNRIKKIEAPVYNVRYTKDMLIISDRIFPIERWEEFTDKKILSLGDGWLGWWQNYKEHIFATIERNPAV